MYLLDYNHPTELFSERREALMREARDAHLVRELREARSKSNAGRTRSRSKEFVRRMTGLWGQTSVPFFKA
jgi:hypothetical protein